MAFKMNGIKFYGDRSRKEMRQDIRAERKSLKEGGATREEVKDFNKYQRKRKRSIRDEVKGSRVVAQGADQADLDSEKGNTNPAGSPIKNYKKGYYGIK